MQRTLLKRGQTNLVLELSAAACLVAFVLWGLNMPEDFFLGLLLRLEKYGMVIGAIEGLIATALTIAMFSTVIRARCGKWLWLGTAAFFIVALSANLLDYWTTIRSTPDLSLENNPVWNASIHVFGLNFGLWTGLLAKLGLSILAAACFAFYLRHRTAVAQHIVQSPRPTAYTATSRRTVFAAVLAFYFAIMNMICFYVAYVNTLIFNPFALMALPPLPAVIVIFLIGATVLLVAVSKVTLLRLPQ